MRRSRPTGFKYMLLTQFMLPLGLVGATIAAKVMVKFKHYEGDHHYEDYIHESKPMTYFIFFVGLDYCFVLINIMQVQHQHGVRRYLHGIYRFTKGTGGRADVVAVRFFAAKCVLIVAMLAAPFAVLALEMGPAYTMVRRLSLPPPALFPTASGALFAPRRV